MMLRMMLKMCQLEEKLSSFARCSKKRALAMGMQISHLNCLISYASTEQNCSEMPFLIPHRPHYIVTLHIHRGLQAWLIRSIHR